MPFLRSITWRCDICHRERSDEFIRVHKVDITPSGFPLGTVIRNVKYCSDNETCREDAMNWRQPRPVSDEAEEA